ncbi:MAG: NAD(P)/FAD-dependent oxidoreductase [Lactobacillaceae bacterium]|jgi:predicted Rossmann fold flavoprotein|nr:NAD(P)/FAD-dependent oxidoreductase [Lactobacillaceae bacterium]
MKKNFDVIIIGAGASGYSCAISALAQNKTVCILEHNNSPLKKVKISGGGRCNFTNLNIGAVNYVTSSNQPNFIKNALDKFSPQEFLRLINKHKIGFAEKAKGQLFTSAASQKIIDMLMSEAAKANTYFDINIKSVNKKNELFYVETNKAVFLSSSLVVATGGLSYPNIGATDLGSKIAKQFGIKIIPHKPALVPLNLDNETMKETIKLKGISLEADVECSGRLFNDNILFTHFGLSGPAILQASLYWQKGSKIKINLLPKIDLNKELKELRNSSKGKKISNILAKYIPGKLAGYIIGNNDCFITEASNKLIESIANKVNGWEITPAGTQGFKLAEVTSGGIDIEEINENFEARKEPKLFFIGEVLDVTGQLGGYNLQWAWSSGFIAGKYV